MSVENKKLGHEFSAKKERLRLAASVITISGRAGTGKTELATRLCELFSIPAERDFKTGQTIRKGEKGLERPLDVDVAIDQEQRDIIRNSATLEKPYIIEGRLAGVIASEERSKEPNLSVVSVLLVAPTPVRMRRIRKRMFDQIDLALNQGKISDLEAKALKRDAGKIHKFEKSREESDLARWRTIHPQLEGTNPFDHRNRDKNGRRIYDVIVNNENMDINETIEAVVSELKKLGVVMEEGKFPKSGVIYKAG